MIVTLKLGEPLWERVGEKSLKVEVNGAPSIAELFAEMERRYPGFAEALNDHDGERLPYNIFRNDQLVRWENIGKVALADGDKVFLFMAVSGGKT